MRVLKLTQHEQEVILTMFNNGTTNKELATFFKVSTSTISKVIGIQKQKKLLSETTTEMVLISQLLYKHKVSYEQLKALLEGTVTITYQSKPTKKSPKAHINKQLELINNE